MNSQLVAPDVPLIDFSQPHCITMEAARAYVPLYFAVLERKALGLDIRQPVPGMDMEGIAPKAIEWQQGSYLSEEYAWTARDGVAIISMRGPIMRYGSYYGAFSGMTSTSRLMTSLKQAFDHDAVNDIVIVWDSPGGDATSISEAAKMIASLRGKGKRIIAYVDGKCCSAAYWLAAACDEIVVSDTGEAGSIGAVLILEKVLPGVTGTREFVYRNSQSPKKYAEPGTKVGDEEYTSRATALAAVFGAHVAVLRGVSEEKVWKDFGQGGVLLGAEAVRVGLCDRLGDFESLITSLSDGSYKSSRGASASDELAFNTMSASNNSSPLHQATILGGMMAGLMHAFNFGGGQPTTTANDGTTPQLQAGQQPVAPVTPPVPVVPTASDAVQPSAEMVELKNKLAAAERDRDTERNARIALENQGKPTREAQIAAFMGVAKPKLPVAQHGAVQALFEGALDGKLEANDLTKFFGALETNPTMAQVPTPPTGATAITPPVDTNINPDDVVDEAEVERAAKESGLSRMGTYDPRTSHNAVSGVFVPGS